MLDIILDTLIDTLKILPFLFLAFLLIEYVEHKLNKKSKKIIEKSGELGPLLGSVLGIFPQCGFSVLATNLYITRIISLGTLISIYLSTSDEMLPILITQKANFSVIFELLLIKFFIGMTAGFIIDLVLRKRTKKKLKREDYSICHDEHCHCEKENIFKAALTHTLKTIFFIMIVSFVLNIIMQYLGNEYIEKIFMKNSIFSPFISSVVGLIPNCSASVILTELYLRGAINLSSAVSGLLTGSGVALLVLFKSNRNIRENLMILSLIYLIGAFSGIVIELIELFI